MPNVHGLFCLPETGHTDLQRELLVLFTNVKDANINKWQSVRLIRLERDDRFSPSIGTELKKGRVYIIIGVNLNATIQNLLYTRLQSLHT